MQKSGEDRAVACPDCGTRYWKGEGKVWYRVRKRPQAIHQKADIMPRINWCPICFDDFAKDDEPKSD